MSSCVRESVNILICLCWVAIISSCSQNTFKINDYYPIADENEWRYTAPAGWKDGDYISRIEEVSGGFSSLFTEIQGEDGSKLFALNENDKTFRHYDATKASKLLSVNEEGIFYHGEAFSSDGSIAVFEKPIRWFKAKEWIKSSINVKRNFIRFFKDGTRQDGIFTLKQKVAKKEDVSTPAGNFKDCLRIEFNTYWDLGKGTEAKSINVYYHAKDIGVVKASARFIILKNDQEIINRLVQPELKSYTLNDGSSSSLKLPISPKVSTMHRIKMATIVSQDIETSTNLYQDWLNYSVVEEGVLSSAMTKVWGTPKMTGKPYALLQPESGDDVYLRVIQGTVPKNYKAMTTYGWNAIELIVEDPDAVYEKLLKSPFTYLDGPANLGDEFSTIRAVQFKGPSEEVFYFTTDTGDRSTSTLLTSRSSIDRIFIMVVGVSNARVVTEFYKSNFGVKEAFFINTPIGLIASAQNLPDDHKFPLSLVRLGAFSNSIEIDEYPKTAQKRPVAEGELPPGISISSFTVENLDLINPTLFVSTPEILDGIGYNGNRTATIIGPAGEMIELIEEKKE